MVALLAGGMVLFGLAILLPLLLVALVLKVAVKILILPFKIVGAWIGLGLGVTGFALGLAVLTGGLLLVPALALGLAILFLLLPVLAGGAIVWGIVRLLRPRPA